jgi:hypothetical protein
MQALVRRCELRGVDDQVAVGLVDPQVPFSAHDAMWWVPAYGLVGNPPVGETLQPPHHRCHGWTCPGSDLTYEELSNRELMQL